MQSILVYLPSISDNCYLAAYTSCMYFFTKSFKIVEYMEFHTKMLHNIVANSLLANEILFPIILAVFVCLNPQMSFISFYISQNTEV